MEKKIKVICGTNYNLRVTEIEFEVPVTATPEEIDEIAELRVADALGVWWDFEEEGE